MVSRGSTGATANYRPEELGDVVVLEDGAVVIEDGEAALGVDVEVVGGARVVVVVDDGRDQRREDLQVRQPVLEQWTRDQSRF